MPLAGRSAQLSWIEEQVAAGGSVVVAGEAGVGKTRLLTEVIDRADRQGRPVARVVAAGSPLTLALPLAPLTHLLPPTIDPQDGMAALRQALDALRDLGGGEPLLVGVDDAPGLDGLSALVLQQAIAASVIQVVATARTGGEMPEAVEQLWRSPGGARLDLQALDPVAVAALLESALGGPVDRATVAMLGKVTRGSPLMLLAVIDHGRATGRLDVAGGIWVWSGDLGVSARLQELVGFSLDRLAPDEREIVELVALAEPLRIDVLDQVVPDGVAASLEARGLLGPGAHDDVVRPGHPLIGEAALAGLKPLGRRRLLGRLVDAFATIDATGSLGPDDRSRVAQWALECGRQVAVEDLRDAARLARSRGAPAQSERLARAAFEREPDVDMGVLLGRTLHAQLHYEEADALYAQVALLASTDDELVDIAVNRALTLRFGLGLPEEAARVVDTARRRIADPARAWELAATEARDAILAGHIGAVPSLWAEAADAPESARFRMADSAAAAFGAMGQLQTCAEVVHWAESVASRHEQQLMVVPLAQFWLAASLGAAGAVTEAEAMAGPAYDRAVEDGQHLQQVFLAAPRAVAMLHAGDPRSAEQFAREAALAPASSKSVRLVGLGLLASALLDQDRCADAAEVLATIESERDPLFGAAELYRRLVTARLAHREGREAEAFEQLDEAYRVARRSGTYVVGLHVAFDVIRLGGSRSTIEDAVGLAADVEGALGELVAGYGRAALERDAAALVAVADRAIALDVRSIGVAALTSAIECERALERNAAAAALEARRADVLAQCPGLVVIEPRVDLGLSVREREIARLAAEGLPDKRIAADLGISVRTVNAHLRSVYTKLGVSSRLDLVGVPGLAGPDHPEH